MDGVSHSDLHELRRIAVAILDPTKELPDLIPQAEALRDFLERKTSFRTDDGRNLGAGETLLDSGLAISPALAAMCLRELFRTPAFIRGLHQAIRDTLRPDRPVRILYAGCGPYALLALPLMTVLSREQATFTLLDLHRESLDKALALATSLGLADHIDDSACVDATRYRIPADKQPDVIVSETMAVCLRNEPQVSIARNLLIQAPQARLVPQSVSIEMGMVDWSKEHVFMPADHIGEIPPPARDRLYLGRIFELDAAGIRRWEGIQGPHLPAGRVTIPLPLESRYKPCLLTRIAVYGRHCLQDYDCSLTMPQHLPGRPALAGGEKLQFHYQLGGYPELAYEIQN